MNTAEQLHDVACHFKGPSQIYELQIAKFQIDRSKDTYLKGHRFSGNLAKTANIQKKTVHSSNNTTSSCIRGIGSSHKLIGYFSITYAYALSETCSCVCSTILFTWHLLWPCLVIHDAHVYAIWCKYSMNGPIKLICRGDGFKYENSFSNKASNKDDKYLHIVQLVFMLAVQEHQPSRISQKMRKPIRRLHLGVVRPQGGSSFHDPYTHMGANTGKSAIWAIRIVNTKQSM